MINNELKKMMYIAFTLVILVLVIINIFFLCHKDYASVGTYSSRVRMLNRLKHPNIKHSSEIGSYPPLKSKKI